MTVLNKKLKDIREKAKADYLSLTDECHFLLQMRGLFVNELSVCEARVSRLRKEIDVIDFELSLK